MSSQFKTEVWFSELRKAWLSKEIESIEDLLSERIFYFEDTTAEPLRSWSEIRKVWEEVKNQDILKLERKHEVGNDKTGISQVDLEYRDQTGKIFSYTCRLSVVLNEEGKATEFRQDCTEGSN